MKKQKNEEKDLVDEEVKEQFGVSNPGCRIRVPLKWRWSDEDKQMVPYYDENDALDTYKMIQASAGSCDIISIFERAILGDTSVINLANPFNWGDADVSEIPNNINDLHQMQKDAYNSFNSLDPKVQAVFGNDVNNFIFALNNGTYESMLQNAFKKEEKVENVESEESK